jgi:hypothetical protein
MDVVILPVSNHDNNASVRVASNLFPARPKLLEQLGAMQSAIGPRLS